MDAYTITYGHIKVNTKIIYSLPDIYISFFRPRSPLVLQRGDSLRFYFSSVLIAAVSYINFTVLFVPSIAPPKLVYFASSENRASI